MGLMSWAIPRRIVDKPEPLYRVNRRDHKGRHLYSIAGYPEFEDMDSVTHYTGVIDKPGLRVWYAKQAVSVVESRLREKVGVALDPLLIDGLVAGATDRPEEVKTAAADYGTRVHAAIDHFVLHRSWPDWMGVEIQPAIDSFLKWWGTGRKILMGDTFVASKKYQYGGAFDAIEVRDDGLWIQDWKSSNSVYDEMAIQVGGGYTLAYEETFGCPVAGATIVRFGKKEPEFEALDVSNISIAQSAFLHARGLRLALEHDLFIKPKKSRRTKNVKGPGRKADEPAADGAGTSAVRA